MRVGVIIPTFNEEGSVGRAIESALDGAGSRPVEVVVADGGSTDRTVEVAQSMGIRVVRTGLGRGVQMDGAAESCSAEVFLFLHADSLLPEGWYDAVGRALKDSRVVGGGFSLSIDSDEPAARLVERGATMRAKALGLVYGDQAIFVRADIFRRVGGFRGMPLLEDVDLIRRLRKVGKVVVLKERVLTSPRMWQKRGYVGTTLRNWYYLLRYYAGVPPERLYRDYYKT